VSRLLMFFLLFWVPVASMAATAHLTLRGLDGRTHHLADYRGKWVVVNYWASWCSPCREEIPQLVAFKAKHHGDAVLLGVDMEHLDRATLSAFVRKHGINYPILLDGVDAKPLAAMRGLPTTFLVDPRGRVVAEHVGAVTTKGLEGFIEHFKRSAAAAGRQ